MKKIYIIVLIGLLLLLGVGFYFKEPLSDMYQKIYNDVGKDLHNFQKTDLGNMINEFKKQVLAPTPLNIGGIENNVVLLKSKVIAETNIQRYNNGLLPPLIENAQLNAAAKAKAEDMFLNQYFDHVSPSGIDPGKLVKSNGYDYIVTGENLILGNFNSEADVVKAWMNSPGHRANILNERFADIGVAMVKGSYKGQITWIGVQEFGLPLSACAQPNTGLKSQIDVNKNTLDQLSLQITAKKEAIDNTNPRSPEYNVLVDEHNQLMEKHNALTQETKVLILQYNNQVNIFNQCVEGT